MESENVAKNMRHLIKMFESQAKLHEVAKDNDSEEDNPISHGM